MLLAHRLRALRRAFVSRHPVDHRLARACDVERRRLASPAALIEDLEQRRLLTTTYSAGALSVTLSAASTISFSLTGGTVVVTENGTPTNTGAVPAAISSISVTGSTGNDTLDLSFVSPANGFTNASLSGHVTIAAGSGNDTVQGTALADSISGNDGDDVLFGNAGADSIFGNNGGDAIYGGAGNDSLDGGTGPYTDGIAYSNDPAGISGTNNSTITNGYGDTDTLSNIRAIYGSNYADSLTGSSGIDQLNGNGGNDTLVGGAGNDYLNGGDGNDSLVGGADDDTIVVSSGTDSLSGTGGGYDTVSVSAGTLHATTPLALASLTVSAGAHMSLDAATGTTLIKSLSLASTATLDLNDNPLVVDYTGSTPIAAILAALAAGRNGGTWDGNGISSTTVAADADLAIGYGESSDLLGLTGASTASWNGLTVDATSILVLPTYTGDADLDGSITTADVARANDGVHYTALDLARTPASRAAYASWSRGDFDYDDDMDADDYAPLYANAANHGSSVYDVATYGAVLDGTTDDSAAIQDAIDDAPDGSFILIGGTAAVANQLIINTRSDLVILGSATGAGLSFTADSPGSYSAFIRVDSSSYLTFAGLDFDANAYTGSILVTAFSDHVAVRDNSFEDMDQDAGRANSNLGALLAIGDDDDAYVNNTFDNVTRGIFAGISTVTDGFASHVVITDNLVQNTVATGMGIQACYADVERNTVEHVIGAGSGMTISAGGELGIDNQTAHYTIRDNTFDDIAWTGIQSDVWDSSSSGDEPLPLEDVLIEDNSITDAGSGITIRHGKSWVVTGNTITDCPDGGIVGAGGCDITIADNTITVSTTSNSYNAIGLGSETWITINSHSFLLTLHHITIEDNILYNDHANGNGIALTSYGSGSVADDATISGNSIDGAQYAFSIGASDTASLSDVTFDDNSATNSPTGLHFAFVTGAAVTGLAFTNNTLDTPAIAGIDGYAVTDAAIDGFVIDSNTITDAGGNAINIGLDSGAQASDVSITNNIITGAGSATNGSAISIALYYDSSYAPSTFHVIIEGNILHVHDNSDAGISLSAYGGTSPDHPQIYATIDDGNDLAGSIYGVYCVDGFSTSSIILNYDLDYSMVNIWDTGVTHHLAGP